MDSSGVGRNPADQTVKIKALMFARARELCGASQMELELRHGSTTEDCLDMLTAKFPALKEIRSVAIVALNREYVLQPTVLNNGDELALIPPVSGG